MFLVDTNVLSELRISRRADSNVRAWAASTSETVLFISVATILEIERGILRMERRDLQQGRRLRDWLHENVLTAFDGRILPIDIAIARKSAALHVPDPRPEGDALIAATALVHGLTVVTRNTADFEPMGVAVLNPWLAAGA